MFEDDDEEMEEESSDLDELGEEEMTEEWRFTEHSYPLSEPNRAQNTAGDAQVADPEESEDMQDETLENNQNGDEASQEEEEAI